MLGGLDAALEWLTGNKAPLGETLSGVRIRDVQERIAAQHGDQAGEASADPV